MGRCSRDRVWQLALAEADPNINIYECHKTEFRSENIMEWFNSGTGYVVLFSLFFIVLAIAMEYCRHKIKEKSHPTQKPDERIR